MGRKNFTEAQRLSVLAEYDGGKTVEEICRHHQISPATFYKWRKDRAIESDAEKRRLKQLESENARLKKMFSELSMDHAILKEGYKMLKKWQAQDSKKK